MAMSACEERASVFIMHCYLLPVMSRAAIDDDILFRESPRERKFYKRGPVEARAVSVCYRILKPERNDRAEIVAGGIPSCARHHPRPEGDRRE